MNKVMLMKTLLFYCEAKWFPGTNQMRSIVKGWGSHYLLNLNNNM